MRTQLELFYAVYQLGVQQVRQHLGALLTLAQSEGNVLPHAAIGWLWLVALAQVVQISG